MPQRRPPDRLRPPAGKAGVSGHSMPWRTACGPGETERHACDINLGQLGNAANHIVAEPANRGGEIERSSRIAATIRFSGPPSSGPHPSER